MLKYKAGQPVSFWIPSRVWIERATIVFDLYREGCQGLLEYKIIYVKYSWIKK